VTGNGAETARPARDWPRALALFAVAFGASVVRPSVLIGVPLVALLLVLPSRRLPALMAGFLAALLAFGGPRPDGLWYAERAWAIVLAGWFVALTLRWPGTGIFPRAAASVVGALGVVATVLTVQPGSWVVLDWLVEDRIRSGVGAGVEAMRLMAGEEGGVSPVLLATVQQAVEFQAQVFPALLGLASLASLGVAWWLYVRLGEVAGPGLARVRDFRFNDHLVWLFIGGLVLLVLGWGESWGRAGSNAVVFMGALYALRGVAVVVSVAGGLSLFGTMLLGLGLLFVAPLVLALALFIGLGDTWVDLRSRLGRVAARP
jgi:hypothetical protein